MAADNGTSEADVPMALIIRRHGLVTRLTHWLWALALFFLLLSGLQIFNAQPSRHSACVSSGNSATRWRSISAPSRLFRICRHSVVETAVSGKTSVTIGMRASSARF
ncbi:hypothetical protein BLJAPNOD_02695 [Ensifer sp. M14]|nr:hypothetical protein BLJAPNOD_02695 [Ensifer sp. M14]